MIFKQCGTMGRRASMLPGIFPPVIKNVGDF